MKYEPAPRRFHPGQHMHGLEDHDLVEPEATAPPRASEPEPALEDADAREWLEH